MQKWKIKTYRNKELERLKIEQRRVVMAMVTIAIIVVGFFGILILLNTSSAKVDAPKEVKTVEAQNNVSMVGDKQVIVLTAKGGYMPRKSVAKAGVPTILRVSTNGTFDCSSSIRIPALQLSKNLPPTGETDIDLGSPSAGLFAGSCGMGMYPFEIDFRG